MDFSFYLTIYVKKCLFQIVSHLGDDYTWRLLGKPIATEELACGYVLRTQEGGLEQCSLI